MPTTQKLWTREELILAFNLYLKLNFGQMHKGNAEVQHLAKLIGRSPGSIAMRLGNFAAVDPFHQQRGIGGLPGGIKQVQPIWNEFINNREELFYESERLRAQFEKKPIEQLIDFGDIELLEGKDKERLVRVRVNQYMFRAMVLAAYDFKCCVTGIKNSTLLLASHIAPWSKDKTNRLNPSNGLCLNALHDKAFDNYLFTVTPDYKIKLSAKLKAETGNDFIQKNFIAFEGQTITLPQRYAPAKEFLVGHNKVFKERNS